MYYKGFGLYFCSEIILDELIELDDIDQFDVTIKYGSPPTEVLPHIKHGMSMGSVNDVYYYRLANGTLLTVMHGNTILVEQNENYDEEVAKLFILGTCMGVLLMQRGTVSLHGSAIKYHEKGIIIIGESGAGKSTLVNYLLTDGAQIVSDDIIGIIQENKTYYAIPSYPSQKLSKESISISKTDRVTKKVPYISGFRKKFYLNRAECFFDALQKIEYVFYLVADEAVSPYIESAKGKVELELLMNNIYRYRLLPWYGLQEHSLSVCAGIANQAEAFTITRPLLGMSVDQQGILINSVLKKSSD